MERKTFVELCRECAILEKGINGVPYQVPLKLLVRCKSISYYPVGYELTFAHDGSAVHIAILHDLDANSVTRCKLNDVEGLIDKQ